MRLAGTCSKYSKSAMPQLTNAAMYHFRSARFLRCAYQANVMKMFDVQRSKLVFTRTGIFARRLREVLSLASRLAGFGRRAKRWVVGRRLWPRSQSGFELFELGQEKVAAFELAPVL